MIRKPPVGRPKPALLDVTVQLRAPLVAVTVAPTNPVPSSVTAPLIEPSWLCRVTRTVGGAPEAARFTGTVVGSYPVRVKMSV